MGKELGAPVGTFVGRCVGIDILMAAGLTEGLRVGRGVGTASGIGGSHVSNVLSARHHIAISINNIIFDLPGNNLETDQ